MGLFEEAWKNRKLKPGNPKHSKKILDSINILKTEEEFMAVLCTSPHYIAKIEAVNRLSKERLIRFVLEQFPESFYDGLEDPFFGEKQFVNHILDRIIKVPVRDNKQLWKQGFHVDDEALSELKHIADDSLNAEVRTIALNRYQRCTDYLDYSRKMDSPEERFRMACTAQERAEALKECKDEKLIITALDNKDYIVREEAIRRVKDHDAFIQWILGGSSIIPVGAEVFWQRIDELNPEELGRLLDGLQKKHSNDAAYDILLKRVCRNLGHIPGPNCFCTRCGAELPHNFDENGVCRSCQAHIVEEEEILTEAGVEYAKRTNRKLVYSDGKIKHLDPSTIILVDDSTMAWLFPKD